MSYLNIIQNCKKIIAILRNYIDHAKELNNPIPTEVIYFIKPSSSLINSGKSILIPKHVKDLHYEVELGVVIGKNASDVKLNNIEEADQYISGIY